MGLKEIKTSDGTKLVNTETNQLAGSVSKGKTDIPTADKSPKVSTTQPVDKVPDGKEMHTWQQFLQGLNKVALREFATKTDTELAKLSQEAYSIEQDIRGLQNSIMRSAFANFRESRFRPSREDLKEAMSRIEAGTADGKWGSDRYGKDHILKLEKTQKQLVPIVARIEELNDIYDTHPWNRAFLVTNSNGHIHRERSCTTCFPDTQFFWAVEYSGADEAEIVEAAGEMACTVCYPSAPAEFLNKPTTIVSTEQAAKKIARDAREVKRLEKIAKEQANAPTVSGEALRVIRWAPRKGDPGYESLKTERSAVSLWLDFNEWGPLKEPYQIETCHLIEEALANKHGISIEEQREILKKKLAKRR
jgi:hypothetical protein